MFPFTYYNPVKIVFGKGTIAELPNLLPAGRKVMVAYGGGSIRKNGVYDQVKKALRGHATVEFGGIEPNPQFSTLMKAVELGKSEKADFLLAVGGGSVADGVKFIAAAMEFEGDPWNILARHAPVKSAVPMGCVLTLPATGSEMNSGSVVSRAETQEKLFFLSPHVFPRFSILDPETTFTLPPRQTANGIIDSYVHVAEQYLTYPAGTPLQDRQAEAILLTLVEAGPTAMSRPNDYDARATVMWCATQALNGLIGCGTPQDWATHMIGHELTAFHGLDHAQTLAIVLPSVLRHQKQRKSEKLLQYARRVWGVESGSDGDGIEAGIARTEEFFASLGVPTKLGGYGIGSENFDAIAARFEQRNMKLGEHRAIGKREVREILDMCR